tara:strand:+ start:107 stop:721 length:615 start_codon:yes stop_codon:yes gene_type:complete
MEPYLSNKEEEISWDEFEKNLPPIFIQSIADYNLNSETVHIFKSKNSKESYLIETKSCECYLCKKDINFINMSDKLNTFILNKCDELNENILYKINNIKMEKPSIHRIFIRGTKVNSDIYLNFYYHLCNTCFEQSLYYWYITHENNYPSTRIDGFCFIHRNDRFVPEIKSVESLNKIKSIDFPLKFKCEYYNNIRNEYNFMDNQ